MTTVKGEYKILIEKLGDPQAKRGQWVVTVKDKWKDFDVVVSEIGHTRAEAVRRASNALTTYFVFLDDSIKAAEEDLQESQKKEKTQ